jgi:hypothetical protein
MRAYDGPDSLFDRQALQEYILLAGQHPAGGLRDKPPKYVLSFLKRRILLCSRCAQKPGRLPYFILPLWLVGCAAPCMPFTYTTGRGACGVERRRWHACDCVFRGTLLDRGTRGLSNCRLGYEPCCMSLSVSSMTPHVKQVAECHTPAVQSNNDTHRGDNGTFL